MSKCVRGFRCSRGLGAFLLGLIALAGITVAALDLLVSASPSDVLASHSVSSGGTAPANAVLADEWSERIQSDSTWRSNRNAVVPGKAARNKPSQLQGPPQQPNWFIIPAPANTWMDTPRYNDRDSIGPSGPSKSMHSISGYRTVCVRSCDGYFFPISYGTSESSFSRDQATCTNSCSGAKLYYYKAGSEEPEDMVDLSGQKYSKSKNADLFRTQYVESCKCKPHPWEQEASERHRIYALEDQRQKGNRAVVAELEGLKAKNRIDNRSNSRRRPADRRRDPKDDAAIAPSVASGAVAQATAAPRSDVTRGQSGDRVAVVDAQSTGSPPPVTTPPPVRAPGVVTESVAAAASAATVQSVTSRVTATAPVDAGSNRDALHSAAIETMPLVPAIEASQPQPGQEPMAAPEPAEAQPAPLVPKSSRNGRGRRDSALRSSGRQAEVRRSQAPVRVRSSDWARQVFNP